MSRRSGIRRGPPAGWSCSRNRSSSVDGDGHDALDRDPVGRAGGAAAPVTTSRSAGASGPSSRGSRRGGPRPRGHGRARRRARRRRARRAPRRCRSRARRRRSARRSCPARRRGRWSTIAATSQVFSTSSSRCEESQHRAALVDERAHEPAELEDAGRVEPVDRLVEDQQLRDRTAGSARRRAAGACRASSCSTRSSARRPRPTRSSAPSTRPCGAAVARGGVDVQVLAAGEVGVEARLLDDRADAGERGGALARQVVAEQAHAAAVGCGEAEQQADERRLAGAVGARGSRTRMPRGTARSMHVQRGAVAEALAQAVGLDGESVMPTKLRPPRPARLRRAAVLRAPALIRSDERAPVG